MPAGMPSGRRWSSESRSTSTTAWFGCCGGCSNASSPSAYPRAVVEAYYLQRTRLECIAERKPAPAAVDRGWEGRDRQARSGKSQLEGGQKNLGASQIAPAATPLTDRGVKPQATAV